jgi:hypothetical protein
MCPVKPIYKLKCANETMALQKKKKLSRQPIKLALQQGTYLQISEL